MSRVSRWLSATEDAKALDPVSDRVHGLLRGGPLGTGRAGAPLRGSWLGHPLHPLLVQAPLGAWMCVAVLDLMPGREEAARTLAGTGLLCAVPAVVAGLAEYIDLDRRQRRTALLHVAANDVAWVCFAVSYVRRRRGRSGRLAAVLGLTAASLGGALGGHLAYAMNAGRR